MLCRFCGVKNPDKVNFCGNCGKGLIKDCLPYRPGKRRMEVKVIVIVIFLLTLATFLLHFIFEAEEASLRGMEVFTHEQKRGGTQQSPLKEKIESIKEIPLEGKSIDFHLTLNPQEIDGYLNEELFKKKITGARAIHTRLLDQKIELALSSNFLYIPTVFRIRLKPQINDGRLTLSTSGMSIGHLPIPLFLYQFFYMKYPWLDLDNLLTLSGIRLKEIKIDKDQITFIGIWSH